MSLRIALALFAVISSFSIGYFVYSKDRKNILHRSFFLMNASIALWNSADILIKLSPNNQTALFWDRISYIGAFFIIPFFNRTIFSLIDKIHKRSFKTIYRSLLFCSFFLLIINTSDLFIKSVFINPSQENVGSLFFLFPLYFLLGISTGLTHLILSYRETVSLKKKAQLRIVLIGLSVGAIAAFLYFLTLLIPNFPVVFYIVQITYSSIFAYAIIRYNIMNINIIIKKTAVYTILSTSIIGIYIAIILLFESLLHNITGITSLTIRIIAGFVITATFQPLRTWIEIIIDKLFFRGKLDYQEAIAEFTRLLVTVLDLRELLNLIVSMSGLLNTRQVVIFLFDEDTAQYKIRASTGLDQITKEIEFDAQSDLVRLLISTRKVVLRSKIESTYTSSDYAILHAEIDSLKAIIAIPIFIKNSLKGILLLGEKLSEELYSKEDINMLTTLADEAGIAIENAQLYGDLKRTYLETVQALAQAIEASDEYTRGHSDRVTKLAIQIARQLRISRTDIDTLKFAGILHDVGKIGIIKEVLNKPGRLNEAEFNIIRMHPALGEEIIAPVAFLSPIKPIVRHHHERFDGRGYPDGLKGENIPYLSRIIAVADTYDAMTSERPYRPALSTEIALAEIRNCSGTQLDPEIVKAFLEIHPRLQM